MSDFRRTIPSLRDPQQQLREAQDKFAVRLEALEKELAQYKKRDEDDDSALMDADPEPLWDDLDRIHRCHDCRFEVSDGLCQGCGKEYAFMPPSAADSVSTNNEAVSFDRTSCARGTTPLLELAPHLVPRMYALRKDEYEELLARGATRLMCETFELQFTPDVGIVAWADQDLFDEFTGEGMRRGDRWKIRLGRRVELDEEDLDGSQFIEDFLEDAVVFPLYLPYGNHSPERWETVEVTPGVWETRLVGDVADQTVHDADAAGNDAGDEGDHDGCESDGFMYDPNEPITIDGARVLATEDLALGPRNDGTAPRTAPRTAPVRIDVVVQAGYESTGTDSAEELDEFDAMVIDACPDATDHEDTGWEITDIPDAEWPESDEEENEEEDETADMPSNEVGVEDAMHEDKYADDSADSDFDSDEVLSGDEDALGPLS